MLAKLHKEWLFKMAKRSYTLQKVEHFRRDIAVALKGEERLMVTTKPQNCIEQL